jgi:hypothetical protein
MCKHFEKGLEIRSGNWPYPFGKHCRMAILSLSSRLPFLTNTQTIKCLLIAPNPDSALNEEAGKMLLEAYEDYAKRARLHTSIHAQSGKLEYKRLADSRKSNGQSSPIADKHAVSSEKISTSISTSATEVTSKPQSSPKASSNVLTASTINNITQKRSAADADLEVKPVVKSQKTAPMDKKKRNLKRL